MFWSNANKCVACGITGRPTAVGTIGRNSEMNPLPESSLFYIG